MRSTSRMALSTMPSTSGVSIECPSGLSRSGSNARTSIMGRPIGFGSASHDHSAPERSNVSTASTKCATYFVGLPSLSTSASTMPQAIRSASLSHSTLNCVPL